MKIKNLQFVLYCVIFWLNNQTESQTAKCDYSYEYFWASGYRTTNVSYYTCYLNTRQANYDEKVTSIDGQHGNEHIDADVKYIRNYKNQKLKTFSSIFCQKFPNLEVIQTVHVELESIDEDSLKNCKNLEHLWLFGNKIRELPENLLIKNSNLTYLRIQDNKLTSLHKNFFLNQNELEDLILSNNQINFLPSIIFRSLVKLELLHLNSNKFQSINSEWFTNLHNLKWLRLDQNQISEIPSKWFTSLRNLEKLWLLENKIKILYSDSFDGLQNLQILGLYNNDISDLPTDVFRPLTNLKQLYLDTNKLITIHSDSFGVHKQLERVDLENNKIIAIDEKFIDNTVISTLNMTNNVCSQLDTKSRNEIKPNLKNCFDNYQPRHHPHHSFPFRNQFPTSQTNICGKSLAGEGNIIGGTHISRGSFPWIAALITSAGQFFCGGTLISNRKVLTAAHCIQEKHTSKATSAGEIVVLLGVHDLNKIFEIGRVAYAVETVNVHSDWNTLSEPYDYDIAVLVLDIEVVFNKLIQPICLPTFNSNITIITNGIVVGFGRSEDESKFHENIPKMIETPIHTNEDCFLKNYLLATLSSKRTFCGGTGTGIGVCKGDSGSGLFVTAGSAYHLLGIVSSSIIGGRYGCDVNSYAVFTDVTKYIDWINGISTSRF